MCLPAVGTQGRPSRRVNRDENGGLPELAHVAWGCWTGCVPCDSHRDHWPVLVALRILLFGYSFRDEAWRPGSNAVLGPDVEESWARVGV